MSCHVYMLEMKLQSAAGKCSLASQACVRVRASTLSGNM